MSTDENKALARRIVDEMWNTGNLDVIDEVYAPSEDGHEGVRMFVTAFRAAFPDLRIEIEDQIAEGNRVATRYTSRGTHQGAVMGIPPTGEQLTMTAIETHRFEDGKLVDLWNSFDPMGMMQRLGAVANRALVRRWYDEFINEHNVDALDDLLAPDFVSHFLGETPGKTRDELKLADGALFAAFPDLRVTVEDMVAEGDRVAVRYSTRGAHQGDALGTPATGKAIEGTAMDHFRIANGKIAERWAELDFTGFLVQIGAVPG